MAEKLIKITAGNKEVFEVMKSADGQTVTVRLASNHENKMVFPSSVMGTLINALRDLERP